MGNLQSCIADPLEKGRQKKKSRSHSALSSCVGKSSWLSIKNRAGCGSMMIPFSDVERSGTASAIPIDGHRWNISPTVSVRHATGLPPSDSGKFAHLLQHISDRDLSDAVDDPSVHPTTRPMFLSKSDLATDCNVRAVTKAASTSSIFIDDSTVSQPDLRLTLKCVSLAIFYHIKNNSSNRILQPHCHGSLATLDDSGSFHRSSTASEGSLNISASQHQEQSILDIFDEYKHPLTNMSVPQDYSTRVPEHRHIYRFMRTIFSSAQLTSECGIISLIYLERLLKYGDITICPGSWKRMVLGVILLASKVWDDQAVWNVDYCQILSGLSVEDMNELERRCLEMLQFNINVPCSVYAKYYFDLRILAYQCGFLTHKRHLSLRRAVQMDIPVRNQSPVTVRQRAQSLADIFHLLGRPCHPGSSVLGGLSSVTRVIIS